ncbi:MAG: hypothetical protein ACFFAS_06675 [Promethearchaeota archaeon]
MSEEPQFPPLPDIGEVLERKKRLIQKVISVVKCGNCNAKYERGFLPGDYTFKKNNEEICQKCREKGNITIEEIFSEWVEPKKKD